MFRVYMASLTSLLVKPLDTHRQPEDLAVVPHHIRFEFVLLAVSHIVNDLPEGTGKVALTLECPCVITTVNELCRVNSLQHIPGLVRDLRICDNDPFAAQFSLKPPVDEEFVTPSGGRLEEQRR